MLLLNKPFKVSQVHAFYVIAVISILWLAAYLCSKRPAPPIKYIAPHPDKIYIMPPHWKGTSIDKKNRYVNDEYAFYQNYIDIIKWFPGNGFNIVRNYRKKFDVIRYTDNDFLKQDDTLIWLGHASFFLRINQVNILIDPQFFNTSFYKRHSENPVNPDMFLQIDYILLSHDHEDHCDKKSLDILVASNPHVKILTGLGMDKLLQDMLKKQLNIYAAEWYEQYPEKQIEIYFVPTRHYSKRLFKKYNSTLWGGFIIKYKKEGQAEQVIFWGGDSGYGSHYKKIKLLFRPDIAVLGIGAYKPLWFMHPNHMSPQKALRAFEETGAGLLIPMHYGTFNLSNEMMDDPPDRLLHANKGASIKVLKPGEILSL